MQDPSGMVMEVQHYSTKDGPGIRTTAFLVGCNLRCLWCANPESMLSGEKVMHHGNLCRRCGACVAAAAPTGSVTLRADGIRIDRGACTNLDDLVDVCNYDAYERKGETMLASELARRLLRDEAFWFTSGGGVTFSGGECLLQPDFVAATSRILKDHGARVALDTAGLWDIERVDEALDLADLVLYDIKAFDSGIHRACTGAGNERILSNAQALAQREMPMIVRLVVVPGMNDQPDDLRKRIDFVASLGGCVRQVDILKYHRLGVGKYRDLGMDYPLPDTKEPTDEDVAWALDYCRGLGLKSTVGG